MTSLTLKDLWIDWLQCQIEMIQKHREDETFSYVPLSEIVYTDIFRKDEGTTPENLSMSAVAIVERLMQHDTTSSAEDLFKRAIEIRRELGLDPPPKPKNPQTPNDTGEEQQK